MSVEFVPAPPPKEAPRHLEVEALGVPRGLWLDMNSSQYRCSCCARMQPGGSACVWVPDGISKFDPPWAVAEAARLGAFNGSSSGWCLDCARAIGSYNLARRLASLSCFVAGGLLLLWAVSHFP